MTLQPGELTTTADTRVLFLNMQDIEDVQNVVQTVCEAQKHPLNPILPLGDVTEWDSCQARPWETRTIIYDEEDEIFKCWYAGTDLSTERWWASGYAVSPDGIRWEKPKLGLFEYNGNKDNNICLMGWGPLIKDTTEPDPAKRYKMIMKGPLRERGVRVGYSPDGIHWTESIQIDIPEWEGGTPDIVVLLRDEQATDPARRYQLVWQTSHASNKWGPEKVRTKCLAHGPDVEQWTASPANPILHPNDGLEQENHFLMLIPYCSQYVMLYEYGWYAPNGTGNFGSYCADIRLAVSRDGEHYHRIQPHQKVIARGGRNEWDGGFLVISDKAVIKDDTIYIYYAGNGEDWTSWPGGNTPESFQFRSTGCVRLSRMGLATLRLDGFTCLETADRETPGSATTVPIKVQEPEKVRLVLNMADGLPLRNWIQVEILDAATGEPIPGFTRDDCRPIADDGIRVPVQWQSDTLAGITAQRIKLRFGLCGGVRLHSVAFEAA